MPFWDRLRKNTIFTQLAANLICVTAARYALLYLSTNQAKQKQTTTNKVIPVSKRAANAFYMLFIFPIILPINCIEVIARVAIALVELIKAALIPHKQITPGKFKEKSNAFTKNFNRNWRYFIDVGIPFIKHKLGFIKEDAHDFLVQKSASNPLMVSFFAVTSLQVLFFLANKLFYNQIPSAVNPRPIVNAALTAGSFIARPLTYLFLNRKAAGDALKINPTFAFVYTPEIVKTARSALRIS